MTTTETIRSACECGHEPHEHSQDGEKLGACTLCNCKKYFSNSFASAIKDYKQPPKIANRQEREQLIAVIAEEIMKQYHFATLRDNLELRYYKDGIYIEGAEALIHEYISQKLGYQLKNADRREVIEHIRHQCHSDREDFDAEPDLINLAKGGLLNIRKSKLRPHDPTYLSMSQLPRKYDPYVSCPRFSSFLVEILEKEKIREAVKMLGYMLHRGMEYEKSFVFLGAGANGKSTFLNVIKAFFGSENCSHESLHALVSDRFAAAELYGKYVNLFADLKSGKLPETGPFKMLTSGDPMSAQKKYGKRFTFLNYAKMVFSANIPPEMDDNGFAIYRRLVIFPFDRTFPPNDKLLSELTSEKELTGILNLALKGWRWLLEDGGFQQESVEKVRQEYRNRANNIARFINEMCIVELSEPDCYTKTDDLYNAYKAFCE